MPTCHRQLLRVCRGRYRDGEKSGPVPRRPSQLSGTHQRDSIQVHRNTDWPRPRPSRDTSKHAEGNCAGTRYIDRTIGEVGATPKLLSLDIKKMVRGLLA